MPTPPPAKSGSSDRGRDPDYELIWPGTVKRSTAHPTLVYLDLHNWIRLTRARLGKPGVAEYLELLEDCRSARARRSATFVLSSPLHYEISAIKDPRQRTELAETIDELSDFEYLPDRPLLMKLELASTLDALGAARPWQYEQVTVPLSGLLQAHGMRGGLRIKDGKGQDVTAAMSMDPDFATRLREYERRAEFMFLAGPADQDVPSLKTNGYDPAAAWKVTEERAQQERDFETAVPLTLRRGRLRDAVCAREVNIELQAALNAELTTRGVSLDEVVSNREDARQLALTMPSTRVAIELKTRYHRDPNKSWSTNDVNDIDAMASAVPYCDVVFADAAVQNALAATHTGRLMSTALPRRPTELGKLLRGDGLDST